MQLSFFGAAGTVTGSRYLLTASRYKILVDCGLFQGLKELRLRNWDRFPVDPKQISAVILTHAHIDHSGYLPLLAKEGFKGNIYCTQPTYDLCNILLPDSGYLQEEEARYANLHGYSKHHPALPLYTKEDAVRVLKQFKPMDFGNDHKLFGDLSFRFNHAGHILGASFVTLKSTNTSILFSGDIGRPHDPVMNPPATMRQTDYLILESTYGNRLHEKENVLDVLANIINRTTKRGGSIIIPAFAVGRAQNILFYLHQLKKTARIPNIRVFMDSPMATDVTKVLEKYPREHRLSRPECAEICAAATYTDTQEESKSIDNYPMPIVIISASGMATGGRVLHHLKLFLPDPRHTVLFTGYQAEGTRGDRLLKGEKEIKIHGETVPVRAEIATLSNTSAHADSQEILDWLKKFVSPPRKVFITHGEPEAAKALKDKIEAELGWLVNIPHHLQVETLE